MRQTFGKDERLCRKRFITLLFREGVSIYLHPFRLIWMPFDIPSLSPAQLLISVPRHLYRKAVDRNLIRRRIREAYRKNKHILYGALAERHKKIMLCITYTSKEILPYNIIQEKIIVLLQRLREENAEPAG